VFVAVGHVDQAGFVSAGQDHIRRQGSQRFFEVLLVFVLVADGTQGRAAKGDFVKGLPPFLDGSYGTHGLDILGQIVGLFHKKHVGRLDHNITIAFFAQVAEGGNDVFDI